MRIELLRGLGQPVIIEDVSRILILDDDGTTPLAVASETPGGSYTLGHAAEGDIFNRALRNLGISRTTITSPILLPGPAR